MSVSSGARGRPLAGYTGEKSWKNEGRHTLTFSCEITGARAFPMALQGLQGREGGRLGCPALACGPGGDTSPDGPLAWRIRGEQMVAKLRHGAVWGHQGDSKRIRGLTPA